MALPQTMKAWRFHTATGGAENHMELEDIPLPPDFINLSPEWTLIKVRIVCLNPADIKFAEVPIVGPRIHQMPAIPGMDGIGEVVKTTDPAFQVGQSVVFHLDSLQPRGGLAEYVAVPREGCAALPAGVPPDQASAVGTCGVTAVQAIAPYIKNDTAKGGKDKNRDASPPRVFINGGSGGAGTFQIQVAKALGCYVVTSCSAANIDLCKSLGADEVLDYRLRPIEQALPDLVRGDESLAFDLLVDNMTSPWKLYTAAGKYLKPTGKYIQVGGDISLQSIKEMLKIKLVPGFLGGGQRPWAFMPMKTSRADAEKVLEWMRQGRIKTAVDEVFSFQDAPAAYRKLKTGRAKGKLLVQVQ